MDPSLDAAALPLAPVLWPVWQPTAVSSPDDAAAGDDFVNFDMAATVVPFELVDTMVIAVTEADFDYDPFEHGFSFDEA